jgi:excisionase family DNA binding protein
MTLIEILESRGEALNVHQVAELLGVSEKKVYRLAAAGVLPAFRVGKSIRFDAQDVADWLRQRNLQMDSLASGKRKMTKTGHPRDGSKKVLHHLISGVAESGPLKRFSPSKTQ